MPIFQQNVAHTGADIGHFASIVKRQAEEEDSKFIDVLNADAHEVKKSA